MFKVKKCTSTLIVGNTIDGVAVPDVYFDRNGFKHILHTQEDIEWAENELKKDMGRG